MTSGTNSTETTVTGRWISHAPHLLSLLRIVGAALFLELGTAKLFAIPVSIMPDGSTVQLASLVGVAGVLELVGGILLLLGLFTRPVAFILAGEMAVAYFKGHAIRGVWPVENGGTAAIIFCFLWLYVSAAGPGPWSVDSARRGKLG